jgi:hypothetical protein
VYRKERGAGREEREKEREGESERECVRERRGGGATEEGRGWMQREASFL